jgi:hypothetical protein
MKLANTREVMSILPRGPLVITAHTSASLHDGNLAREDRELIMR